MKTSKVLTQGFALFLISQIFSFLTTLVWLKSDKTDYGFGGGVILLLMYFGVSSFVSVVGSFFLIFRNRKHVKQYLLLIPILFVLHILLIPLIYLLFGFIWRSIYENQLNDGSIIILNSSPNSVHEVQEKMR
jgi:hypothetical protein